MIGTPVPINSILFSLFITILIALLNIGSSATLNAIVALLTGATSFSYALSIACILIKRLSGDPLPPARFSLGRFGVTINGFAILYVVVAAVASFFPVAIPTDVEHMNWSSVMFGGVFIIARLDYAVRGRKTTWSLGIMSVRCSISFDGLKIMNNMIGNRHADRGNWILLTILRSDY